MSAGPIFPARISSDNLSSTVSWISLLSGLAPKVGSYPFWANHFLASTVISNEIPFSKRLDETSLIKMSTIFSMWERFKGWNTTVPSILFKNSGLKKCFTSFNTLSFIFKYAFWSDTSPWVSEVKPIDLSCLIKSEPILLVITMIVFLKSTFLPLESVKCPSSKICKRILNTSWWAFSISSNKITLYDFLLTASVSCPPSS